MTAPAREHKSPRALWLSVAMPLGVRREGLPSRPAVLARRLWLASFAELLLTPAARAQVFDLGPSDPSLFDEVINVPGDQESPGDFGSVGDDTSSGSSTTELNVADGGSVGVSLGAFSGSVVNISDGAVGTVSVYNIAEVNISGGTVDNLGVNSGVVNLSGGSIGDSFRVDINGVVNISGGSIGNDFDSQGGAEVNVFGTEFFLDGVLLDELVLGEAFTITDRNVELTGVLADRSAFDFEFNSTYVVGEDFFSPGATLTVTLVEAQGLPGDYNADGVVNAADYTVWRDSLVESSDLPNDVPPGSVTVEDYTVWVHNFGSGTPAWARAAPDPAAALLMGMLGILGIVRQRG